METRLEQWEHIAARQAIADLNADFCHYLDGNMIAELVGLFTEDASYSHGQRISSGRAEIDDLFTSRTADGVRTSRHMQTGLKIVLLNSMEATGRSVCLTFACAGPPPIAPATPFLVADFIDEYQYCADGQWRIRKRHIERIFTASDNKGPVGMGKNS